MIVRTSIALLGAAILLSACTEKGGPTTTTGGSSGPLKTQIDSVSYLLGSNIGKGAGKDSIPLNMDAFMQGYNDGRVNKVSINDSMAQVVMMNFQNVMVKKQQERKTAQGEKNKTEGAKFLADNKAKEGVKTTASGLQYKVITEGTGKTPGKEDMVQVLYRGTLTDGTPFDSSMNRAQPAQFLLSQVVPGWTEALSMMKEGSKWQVVIPDSLGYGAQGMGDRIAPNAVLVFDMELIKVIPKAEVEAMRQQQMQQMQQMQQQQGGAAQGGASPHGR